MPEPTDFLGDAEPYRPGDTGPDPEAERRRQERRTRLLIAGSAIAIVVVVVVTFIVVKTNSKKPAPSAAATSTASGRAGTTPATPSGPSADSILSILSTLTSVPTSVTDAVGGGGSLVIGKPVTIPGPLLAASGKPEMLYIGAEYCPFCAAQRWSMILALSRFGTFTNLKTTRSAAQSGSGGTEPYPNTPTFTFYGSAYTSDYVTFTPVEVMTNIPDPSTGSYTTLQKPTSAQQALINKWDAPPYVPEETSGSIPFIDIGNKYMIAGASFTPAILANMTWSQIAAAVSQPSSPVAMGIAGAANYITAAICKLTNDQPVTACTSTVKSLQSHI